MTTTITVPAGRHIGETTWKLSGDELSGPYGHWNYQPQSYRLSVVDGPYAGQTLGGQDYWLRELRGLPRGCPRKLISDACRSAGMVFDCVG